jgi:hypothetical protein
VEPLTPAATGEGILNCTGGGVTSSTSTLDQRKRILAIASELWAERDTISLDQVDGTFYVHVCRAEQIAQMEHDIKAGTRDARSVNAHIRQFLPNAPQSSRHLYVIPERPCLRDAVDMSCMTPTRVSADGSVIDPLQADGTTDFDIGSVWIRLGIRNQEWNGTQVAREIARRSRAGLNFYGKTFPHPPYPENEAIAIIGATLHKAGEYGHRVPDPEGSGWEFVPWPPMIVIAVAEPLPPKSVIAEYYDRVVIEQRQWNLHLLGAANGQNVPTAIRTWAVALLMKTGLEHRFAMDAVTDLGFKEATQAKYGRDRKLLLARVPEAATLI